MLKVLGGGFLLLMFMEVAMPELDGFDHFLTYMLLALGIVFMSDGWNDMKEEDREKKRKRKK